MIWSRLLYLLNYHKTTILFNSQHLTFRYLCLPPWETGVRFCMYVTTIFLLSKEICAGYLYLGLFGDCAAVAQTPTNTVPLITYFVRKSSKASIIISLINFTKYRIEQSKYKLRFTAIIGQEYTTTRDGYPILTERDPSLQAN